MPTKNLQRLAEAVQALGPLADEVCFVGGSIVELLVTDAAARRFRPTLDVDAVVGLTTTKQYYAFSERLRRRGFREKTDDGVLCRWRCGELILDVMPSDARALGFTNRWYETALSTAWLAQVDERTRARVATAPCFVATKLEAFEGRGEGDYAASHDIEDLLTILDGRAELGDEVEASPDALRVFLAHAFAGLLRNRAFLNVYEGHLDPGREHIVRARLERIATISSR